MKLRRLIALDILTNHNPRRENRLAGAVEYQPLVGNIDPDALHRHWPRQPACAFEVDFDLAQASCRGLIAGHGTRTICFQGAAQRHIGRCRRRQRLDGRPRIGAADGNIKRGSHIDWPRRQSLVGASKLNGHGAVGERSCIGQESIRQQQFAIERRQCDAALQEIGVEQARIEPVIAGTQHGLHQRVRLCLPGWPYRLEAVARIEAPKLHSIQRFTSDG